MTAPELNKPVPFDADRLDRLLDEAGIDVLVATSKHNVQYLLGGYRFFFFDTMDAIGVSRYLPILVYQKGKPENAAYIGNAMEGWQAELGGFWTPRIETKTWGTEDAVSRAVSHIKSLNAVRSVGVEMAFLPYDAGTKLRQELSNYELADAFFSAGKTKSYQDSEGDRTSTNGFRGRS